VLVAAVIASKRSRLKIGLSALVAMVGVTGTAAAIAGTDEFGDGSGAIVALFYVLLTPPVIVSGLVKQFREAGAVTLETMFGVLCLYLLIGLMFAVSYGPSTKSPTRASSPTAQPSGMTTSTSATRR
jgi:hypothetical protein